jgi:aldehyde dehydrogenase (NAD+)
VKAAFEGWRYGDPTDPAHLQGPQISKRQQERVLAYIEKGRREGARLVVGGGVPAHLSKGFYVEPTLFADVAPDSTIAQEEIFGPVLCAIPFDDDDDAVRIANDSIYGLSGSVTSASEERSLAVARQRGPVVPPGHALRRLQAERPGARERRAGLRGVPRDQGGGRAREGLRRREDEA